MQAIEVMRRNKRIFFVLAVIGTFIYLYLSRLTSYRNTQPIFRVKNGHSLDYHRHNLTKNHTFLEEFMGMVADQEFFHVKSRTAIDNYIRGKQESIHFDSSVVKQKTEFNINEDVLVYLHIQKVGGTNFNEHMLKDIVLDNPCECVDKNVLMEPCNCFTKGGNLWLFSWFTVGWPCGLHADWTMLHECIDSAVNKIEGKRRKRRYFYITLLRDPVQRYISEWSHQRRGSHWEESKLFCNGKRVSMFDVQPCFHTSTWESVTFNEFMDCRFNLATNRMTRMMANLTKAKCYQRTQISLIEKNKITLESALENLQNLSFVGITEFQAETRQLFEKTFNLKFRRSFQLDEDEESIDDDISIKQYAAMMPFIELDVQLYQYARELFLKRLDTV